MHRVFKEQCLAQNEYHLNVYQITKISLILGKTQEAVLTRMLNQTSLSNPLFTPPPHLEELNPGILFP